MNAPVGIVLPGFLVLAAAASCSDNPQVPLAADPDTLLVSYVSPGVTVLPCDDLTPMLDGFLRTDIEDWGEEPFHRLMLRDAAGGVVGNVELRARWTDNTRLDSRWEDCLYLMLRWEDPTLDRRPDFMAYATPGSNGMDPSPIPAEGTCDSVLTDPAHWTRLNADGVEDQVLILVREHGADDPVGKARRVFSALGPAPTEAAGVAQGPWDVWLWRAGRTNDHPVPQHAWWAAYVPGGMGPGRIDVPEPRPSAANWTAGFAEDHFVTPSGFLHQDAGRWPYVRNFAGAAMPMRVTRYPTNISPENPMSPTHIDWNGTLPTSWAMWWPTADTFDACDTVAAGREIPRGRWSEGLYEQGREYDAIPGWGLQTPVESARDVRAKGEHEFSGEFMGWTLEISRAFVTGNPDDLALDTSREFEIVIGIADNSATEIAVTVPLRLVFEPARVEPPEQINRCR